jgi:acetylornithine deacetylase/succinyl-diaminopimelate desuccinylase-like protein
MNPWQTYQEQHKDRFLEELLTLLRIPSISAKTEHNADMMACAQAVEQSLKDAGAPSTKIYETEGHPIVYGEIITDPSFPTVLVYGHYDVQPADPLDLWNSSPFEPTIQDGKIFARGACDDKGQFYMHVKALESIGSLNKTGKCFARPSLYVV